LNSMTKFDLETNFDRAAFDSKTRRKWTDEFLEFFKCERCEAIFLGMPDCHKAFPFATNLEKTIQYNLPRKAICPHCNEAIYDPKTAKPRGYLSLEELLNSDWSWIIKRNDK
jgi:hypothetical protein